MSDKREYVIKNKENRQLILYTDEEKLPENAYPIAPRGCITVLLSTAEVQFLQSQFAGKLIIQ